MGKNNFVKVAKKEGVRDINEKTSVAQEDKVVPAETEDKEMYFDMDTPLLNNKEDEAEMFNKSKASDVKASNYFIMNLQEKLIKEKERLLQNHSEAMKFIDLMQKALNDFSQGLVNHPAMENTEMTAMTDLKEEEDAGEEEDEDSDVLPKKPSYVQISNNFIKTKGLYYIEMVVMNKKHLVGPYSCLQAVNQATKRFHERARYLALPAFQRELKQLKAYLEKRNANRMK